MPSRYASWPSPSDVHGVLQAAGFLTITAGMLEPPLDALPWQEWIDGRVSELEMATDRHPFAGETNTLDISTNHLVDRGADPWGAPSRYVALPQPLLSASSVTLYPSLMYGAAPTTGVTPITLTQGSDYRLEPTEAPGRGQPYTGIAFFWGRSSFPRGGGESGIIRIAGNWGRTAEIPADLWTMVLELTVCDALPYVESQLAKTVLGTAAALGQRQRETVKIEETERTTDTGGTTANPLGLNVLRPGSPGHKLLLSRWATAKRRYRRRILM